MDFPGLTAQMDRAVLNLGGTVRYVSGLGDAVDVRGVFDAAHVNLDVGQTQVESVGPAVFLRLSDLPFAPKDDPLATVQVGGTSYRIKERIVDGLGGVRLLLHREG